VSPGGRGRRASGKPPDRGADPFDRYASYDQDDAYDDYDSHGDRPPAGQRLTAPIGRPPRRRRATAVPAHLAPRHDRRRLIALVAVCLLLAAAAFAVQRATSDDGETADQPRDAGADGSADSTEAATGSSTSTAPEQAAPASGFETPGLLTFRGGPSRSYYGEGPVPQRPEVLWSYPGQSGGMCAESSVGSETKVWCGTGWTGQPSVFERDGRTWVVFGAYDRSIHFVDYETGQDILPPFPTGDIIKGSVSIDGEGLPLVYSGSRDN